MHKILREEWIRDGFPWRSNVIMPPPLWNASDQLIRAKMGGDLPWVYRLQVTFTSTLTRVDKAVPSPVALTKQMAYK